MIPEPIIIKDLKADREILYNILWDGPLQAYIESPDYEVIDGYNNILE